MSAVTWLLQANHPDLSAFRSVADLLDELGVPWTGVTIDFASLALPSLPDAAADSERLCYGPGFIRRIDHHDPAWRIGSIFDPDTFLWSQCHRHWGDRMVSRGRVLTPGEWLASPPAGDSFARPDGDSKAFDGGVYAPEAFRTQMRKLPSETWVVCAPPVTIDAEYRVFIVGDDVVGASQYRRAGEACFDGYVPDAVIDLALEANAIWQPREAYVLDIARSGDRWGIVEVNCITAARFYSAQPRAVVSALCDLYR